MKSVFLFVVLPLTLIGVYTTVVAGNSLPVSQNLGNATADITYTGMAITIASIFASLLGNERISGLSLRAAAQCLTALYSIYIFGREYSFIVVGKYSLSVSLFPLALIAALLSLFRIVPAVFEHIEKKNKKR